VVLVQRAIRRARARSPQLTAARASLEASGDSRRDSTRVQSRQPRLRRIEPAPCFTEQRVDSALPAIDRRSARGPARVAFFAPPPRSVSSASSRRARPLCPARSDDPCLRPAPDASVGFARPPRRRSIPPAGRRRAGPFARPPRRRSIPPAGRRRAGRPLCPTPRSDGPYVPTAPRRVGRLCPARSDDPCLRRAPDTSVPFARPPPRRSVSPAGRRRAGIPLPDHAATAPYLQPAADARPRSCAEGSARALEERGHGMRAMWTSPEDTHHPPRQAWTDAGARRRC
jgi:hypothetical protein